MSSETDAPIRTLCPICSCWAETEGQDASPVSYANGEVYHTHCLETEVAQEDAALLRKMQWMRSVNDLLLKRGITDTVTREYGRAYVRGDTPEEFANTIVGAQLRAEGEQE